MPCSSPGLQPTVVPPLQRSFQNLPSREPVRRMHVQELRAELSLDRLQLEALHKVGGTG